MINRCRSFVASLEGGCCGFLGGMLCYTPKPSTSLPPAPPDSSSVFILDTPGFFLSLSLTHTSSPPQKQPDAVDTILVMRQIRWITTDFCGSLPVQIQLGCRWDCSRSIPELGKAEPPPLNPASPHPQQHLPLVFVFLFFLF